MNLKNDTLRRRFDSIKYDIKKIEEGKYHSPFALSPRVIIAHLVVYDVSLRKLSPARSGESSKES